MHISTEETIAATIAARWEELLDIEAAIVADLPIQAALH